MRKFFCADYLLVIKCAVFVRVQSCDLGLSRQGLCKLSILFLCLIFGVKTKWATVIMFTFRSPKNGVSAFIV